MTTPRFRKFTDQAGQWRWSLVSGNGEIIATSESYSSAFNRDRSISAMKRIMATTFIADTWNPSDVEPADHQAARQEFARRATDRDDRLNEFGFDIDGPDDNPDGPDEAA